MKKGAKWVEGLERLVIKEQTELEKVIQLRWAVNTIRRVRYEIVQNRMNPLDSGIVLAPRPDDPLPRKSASPERYIGKMRHSVPALKSETLRTLPESLPLPNQVKDLLVQLQDGLSEGCIPSTYKVTDDFSIQQTRC